MTKNDIKRLDDMLKEDFVKNNKRWKEDLELMKKIKMKAEIQAINEKSKNTISNKSKIAIRTTINANNPLTSAARGHKIN